MHPPKVLRLSRRSVLAALPLLGCANEAEAHLNRAYITPDGEGDGSSWAHAARLVDLTDVIARMTRGGEVLVAADRGEYLLGEAIAILNGGVEGHEILIRGANSATDEPMAALLRGGRSGEDEGADVFRLLRGASHLRFSHFDFRDIGNGAFRVAAPIANLTVEDCTFENIYRFFENTTSGDERHATVNGFTIRRCRGARVERGFLRVRYNSREGLIEDCAAQGQMIDGEIIPAGCALSDRANTITYRRVVMENFQERRGVEYWNGDGFSDEPDNANIRYEYCEARGSTDGGFDCKSRDVVLDHCVSEDNKRNFRIWSERATLTNCTSRAPNFRGRDAHEHATPSHIWIAGEDDVDIQISNLTIEDRDATPIIEFENYVGRVKIRDVTVESPRLNWGVDEVRIRANVLSGELRFHPNVANE